MARVNEHSDRVRITTDKVNSFYVCLDILRTLLLPGFPGTMRRALFVAAAVLNAAWAYTIETLERGNRYAAWPTTYVAVPSEEDAVSSRNRSLMIVLHG